MPTIERLAGVGAVEEHSRAFGDLDHISLRVQEVSGTPHSSCILENSNRQGLTGLAVIVSPVALSFSVIVPSRRICSAL